MQKTKKILAVALTLISFVSLVACVEEDKKTQNFETFYQETCGSNGIWVKMSPDGKTLSMDTIPYDGEYDHVPGLLDDDYFSEVVRAIEILHQEYNIPSYINEQIVQTSPADGKQRYDGENLVVWWTYSKTEGLEITYELK